MVLCYMLHHMCTVIYLSCELPEPSLLKWPSVYREQRFVGLSHTEGSSFSVRVLLLTHLAFTPNDEQTKRTQHTLRSKQNLMWR